MTIVAATRSLPSQAQPRLLAGLADSQPGLLEHELRYGPLPMQRKGRDGTARLIDVVERSGLTGRGGAGFPTGRKMRSIAAARRPAVVVANGAEGEPASRKDQMLLSRAPHLVMDGITLAARCVGAKQAYLCVHRTETRLLASLDAAAEARNVAGIDPVPIRTVAIPGRYTSSEQSAIVHFINGGVAKPTFAPPAVHERGVGGRPTMVSNVETLAHVALIARFGDHWFRGVGLPYAPGTTLVTVSGAVARPGVYEVELGTPIGEILLLAGGPTERPQAVLVGGYFGTWLPAETAWPVPLSHPTLRAVGGAMGAGILVVLPESACGLAETARVIRYLAGETAGQCGPCVLGLPALADVLAELAYTGGRGDAADRAAALIPLIEGRGACRHPDGATQLVRSALRTFCSDAKWHDSMGACHGVRRPPMLPLPDEPEDEEYL
jgi:NADH:ubiquinone oxidoreductase subunit F (NADH-binding)